MPVVSGGPSFVPPGSRRVGSRGPARASTVNLRDVARRAGVSIATASRVFSGRQSVKPDVKSAVLSAADELGYVVNGLARSMMGRGARAVGVLVDTMVGPTFAALAAGVEAVASERGLLFQLCTTRGDPERERQLIDVLREQRAAAVLLVGSAPTGPPEAARVRKYARDMHAIDGRLVLCGRPAERTAPLAAAIDYDHFGGMYSATSHLLELGHRHIAFIGARRGFSTSESRLEGYRHAIADSGVALPGKWVRPCEHSPESGEVATRRLLDEVAGITALVCATDTIAIGAYRELRRRGIGVPQEISVVGFDDMMLVGELSPPLTTVRVPFEELGRRAAAMGLGLDDPSRAVILSTELVIRGSTGPPSGVEAHGRARKTAL